MPPNPPHNACQWHALEAVRVSEIVATRAEGLTTSEAENRLAQHGGNTIATVRSYSALRCFFSQFNNILIYILLAAALTTALMQHWTDTGVIAAVILINAMIGFIQEQKAENALAAIRNLLSPRATVLRSGATHLIDAALLVPGDIVILSAGDKVPADLRLVLAHSLRMQEAILTGESLDVEKSTHTVAEDAALGERSCMAYSGTLVKAKAWWLLREHSRKSGASARWWGRRNLRKHR